MAAFYPAASIAVGESIFSSAFHHQRGISQRSAEIVLFLPQVVFKMPEKDQVTGKVLKFDQENMKRGLYMFLCIIVFAFGLDFYVKSSNPKMYIPLNH